MTFVENDISSNAQRPWFEKYPPQVGTSINYPDKPLTKLLMDAVKDFPHNTATVFLGAKLTYTELWEEVKRFGSCLTAMGVKKGDRIGLMLPNCPQGVIAYYGILSIGGVVVQINPLYVERELEFQLQDSGSETLVVLDLIFPRVKNVWKNTMLKNVILVKLQDYMKFPEKYIFPIKTKLEGKSFKIEIGPGLYYWSELMGRAKGNIPETEIRSEDLALIQYTGGTTGTAKGAMLTHRNLLANVLQVKEWMLDAERGKEKMLCALPFFHVYGMTVAMNLAVAIGAELIILPKFEIKGTLKAIKKYQPTFFPGAPTMYVAINTYPEVKNYDISSIRTCISGSAPLPVEVQETFERLTGGNLVEGYGLTESSPVTHCNPLTNELRRYGTIGVPLPDTDCKIVDPETRKELSVGEIGELAVKGPQVMKGYWNNEEATASSLNDGWLLTGDIAKMDSEGYFTIVDRKKDVIIASGFNIYPREVEEVLYQHPGVKEAAVLGVPDSYRGETVKAYIVLKEGKEASEADIKDFCRKRLAAFKVPRIIEFRNELPKTIVGKVLKRQLKEEN